jgi:exo-beta-1,3-glucanase (GH17 family)
MKAASIALVLALGACATAPKKHDQDEPDAAVALPIVRRAMAKDVLARHAIAYSGYRKGQSPELAKYPSKAEIAEDLALLVRGGFTLIRLFDASTHAERVLEVIAEQKLDIKVMQGAWISGGKAQHDAANAAQLDKVVALAAKYPDTIVAISIGNETLDDWSNVKTPVPDLVGYIRDVRARVSLPVTTDDSWLPFALGKDGATDYANVIEVARACDFLSLHVYAFADAYYESWAWKQESVPLSMRPRAMMDAAAAYNREALHEVRGALGKHGLEVPIVIGEAGWKDRTEFTPATPDKEQATEYWLAHAINQKWFYDDLVAWVYGAKKDQDSPLAAFYFEAFDEPWKDDDDHWGLFDVERHSKYVVWEQFPAEKPAGAVTPKLEDAACYKP